MKRFGLLLAVLFSGVVCAQQFPTKTVRFVSGVSPGSASDTMARILADKLQGQWGHPVIVENRLGAGGLVGAKYVAQSEPDGHLIMMYASAFTVSTLLSPNVLDPKDMQAVATVATIPTVLVTPPEKYKTIKDFRRRGEGQSRQAGVRRRRYRQRDPHGVRALPLLRRHRAGAERAHQGGGRGAHRGNRRPRRLLLRPSVPGEEDGRRRQGRGARDQRAEAQRADARDPDARGAGLPERQLQLLGRRAGASRRRARSSRSCTKTSPRWSSRRR